MGSYHCAASHDYRDIIASGQLSGHLPLHGFGERAALTTVAGGNDLWAGTAVTCPIPASAGEQMSLISTSAQDVDLIGTGARSVDVTYIDSAGKLRHEVVSLNGTFAVNMIATNVRFVNSIHAESWGANNAPIGTITIFKTGSPTIIYNQIDPQTNMSINSARMVPANTKFFLDSLSVASAGNDPVSVRLRATSTEEGILANGFLFKNSFTLFNSALSISLRVPVIFPGLSIIKATAYSQTAGSRASLNWSGWYEPE